MEFYIILSHCQLPGDSPSKIEYMHLCWHLAVLMSMLLEENVFGESELMVFYLLPLFLVSQATICKEKMIIKKKKKAKHYLGLASQIRKTHLKRAHTRAFKYFLNPNKWTIRKFNYKIIKC